jgi:fimbrial chaperone protein
MKPFFRPVCLAGALGMAVAGQAQAAATILLWPIDPWLAADANATELWIQNQGNSATTMQVRIVRWKQEDGHERYTAQQDVVASPPIVTIGTGSKQLIRLIKQASVPAGVEQAYRIIVDEIPQPDAKAEPAIGLKLQMRYSIPLFVYGQGSRPSKRARITRWWRPKPELAGDAGGGAACAGGRNRGMSTSG